MKLTSIPQLARNINRLREFVTILSKYGLADWVSRLDLDFAKGLFKARDGARMADLSHESRIRLVLLELGTTFIKLGQLLSTRPDLVGVKLANELTTLQDHATADPPHVVRTMVEAELGQPVADLFAEFDEQPLASASIAQVHRARLKDGRAVVLKVQHPGIETGIRTDLDIFTGLAELAEKYLPELRAYRPRATAAEFQRMLLRELDFGREERNLQQFSANFAADPTVRFPAPIAEWSTSRVLTMELLEGVKLAEPEKLDALGYDRAEVARRGARVFLEMIFRDGFYHADPHPGNLLVLPGGVVGLLDCGMVGRLDEATREDIEDMLLAIAAGDARTLAAILTRLGSVPPEVEQGGLLTDVTDFVSYYSGQSLQQLDLGGALTELSELLRRYHVVLPAAIAVLFRVLVILEGTSRLLNPQFSLIELLHDYRPKLLRRRLSPARHLQRWRRLFREWQHLGEVLPRGLADILQQVQSGRFEVHLEHRHLAPSINRLVLGMLTSALFLGSTLLWSNHVPPLLGDVSVFGVIGCAGSLLLGLRLLWAIRKSGHLDR